MNCNVQGNKSSCEWDGGMSMVRSVRGKRGRYGVILPYFCLRLSTDKTKGRMYLSITNASYQSRECLGIIIAVSFIHV